MPTTDLLVIAAYMALTLGVGLWMAQRARSAEDYFLGARNLPAPLVLLSIVATETSALTVISVPGIAARGDFTFLQLAFGYLIGRMAVAWWLLPGYFRGTQSTAYQRLGERFGPGTRQAMSGVFLATRFLADGVRIFAGAIPLAVLTGWEVGTAILVMGGVTLAYTFVGGLKAVVWADALQMLVYVAGGLLALGIALHMAGGPATAWDAAAAAGKLRVLDLQWSWSAPYTLAAGLVGGALLSAASHGTDHIIVQRLLATRSLRAARWALVGSGVVVIAQFALFLALGTALWAAGQAPADLPGDQLFPRFIVQHLPVGLAGLMMAGILAAAMSTISSSISALASSVTHDLVAPWHERRHGRAADGAWLLRVGRGVSLAWGLALTGAALGFHAMAAGRDTPVVVLALSIASVTYGALLGTVVLAALPPRLGLRGSQAVTGAAGALLLMALVVFAGRLSAWPPVEPLQPVLQALSGLAFPWFVPLGTVLTLTLALLVRAFGVRPWARPPDPQGPAPAPRPSRSRPPRRS
jgi:SSS family solute:Na+ symporter